MPGSSHPDNWAVLAMRQGPWTFLTDASGGRRGLFDVIRDPEQRYDLSTQQGERAESMLAALRAWQAGLSPPSPTANRSAIDRTQQRAEAFNRQDTDTDGKVSLEKFLESHSDTAKTRRTFAQLDANGDQTLSRKEFVFREDFLP